jgi:ABC-2 type transport system permease protein
MTLTRLEVLRMLRTHRWLALFGIYVFFGVVGPLTARYINELIERFGTGDMVISAPDPEPVDGVLQFIGNASQLGLLAVVLVVAAALSVDARPAIAAFLRTRVTHAGTLVLPRFVVAAATAVAALVAGTAVAWAMTAILLGALPAGSMIVGTAFGALYLVFAVALVAAVSGVVRSVPGVALGALGVLILMPIVSLVPTVGPWLPSHLFSSVAALVDGAGVEEFVRAALVTTACSIGLVVVAMRLYDRREL